MKADSYSAPNGELEDKMDGQPELVRRRFSGREEWRYFAIENWNNDRKTDPNDIYT